MNKTKDQIKSEIPIIRTGDCLFASIVESSEESYFASLQKGLALKAEEDGVCGVILDISAVNYVDSYKARMISSIASVLSTMDLPTVLVGMRPSVAMTLVEMGLALPNTLSAMNIDAGVKLLKKRAAGEADGNF